MIPLDLDLPLTVSPGIVSPTRRIIEAKLGPVLEDEDAIVRVAVTNNSTPEHINQLGACYAEMNAASDAMAHYFTLMRRNAKAGATSRLGLARVRAEGEMEIEVEIQGAVVKVTASGVVMR